jgi:hypothetical protein
MNTLTFTQDNRASTPSTGLTCVELSELKLIGALPSSATARVLAANTPSVTTSHPETEGVPNFSTLTPHLQPPPQVKIVVLQRWIGLVEIVGVTSFTSRLLDETNPASPIEEVELPLSEIHPSDLHLVAPGSSFYWSIGYQGNPVGRRKQISTLRFARQPHLNPTEESRLFREADILTALIER